MPLSFDPDWRAGGLLEGADPAPVVGLNDAAIPAGSEGDTLVLFMVFDMNFDNELASVVSITQNQDPAGVTAPLTVVSEQEQANNAATILTATGTRIADLDGITIVLDPGAGPVGYAVGNFPPGTVPRIVTEHNYPYVPRLSETITAPGSGIFAGMMLADGPDPDVDVTPTGAGGYEEAFGESGDYELVAWAYETATADATFDLVSGGVITYDIILGDGGRRWTVGAAGWS